MWKRIASVSPNHCFRLTNSNSGQFAELPAKGISLPGVLISAGAWGSFGLEFNEGKTLRKTKPKNLTKAPTHFYGMLTAPGPSALAGNVGI